MPHIKEWFEPLTAAPDLCSGGSRQFFTVLNSTGWFQMVPEVSGWF